MNSTNDHMKTIQNVMTRHAINYIEKQQGRTLFPKNPAKTASDGQSSLLFIGCTFEKITFNQQSQQA